MPFKFIKHRWLILLTILPLLISMKSVDIELKGKEKKEIPEDFLSFAVDLSQVMGRSWWSPKASVEGPLGRYKVPRLDWKSEVLKRFTSPFSGSYLRLGGSLADSLEYLEEELQILDEALVFTKSHSMKLVFAANALNEKVEEKILSWNKKNDFPIKVWEFGNEPNAYVLLHGLNGFIKSRNHAENWLRFKDKIPNTPLAGPVTAFWPIWGEPLATLWGGTESFIKKTTPSHITWHYYPQQSRRCGVSIRPAKIDRLLDPIELDEILDHLKDIKSWRDKYSPQAEIWLGETGNAQCGGEPGVSDRWSSSLWWMDQLNLMAFHEMDVVVRQSIHGANYGLLSEDLKEIRPDYWTTLLWKQIIKGKPQTVLFQYPLLRFYLFKNKESYNLVAINLSNEEIQLNFPVKTQWRTWLAHAPSLDSPVMTINGQEMPKNTNSEVTIPKPNISGLLRIQKHSILFAKSFAE